MKKIVACCMFLVGLISIAHGGQSSKIELTDGSVIEAEVISLTNGSYALNSRSLGKINVDASKIRKIESSNVNAALAGSAAIPSNDALKAKMDSLSATMSSDPDIMKTIADLAMDPQFQELLKNPEVVNAVKAGDMQALMSNQKFMSAIHNPKIEEIQGRLKEKGD